jgi:hypothetical protein
LRPFNRDKKMKNMCGENVLPPRERRCRFEVGANRETPSLEIEIRARVRNLISLVTLDCEGYKYKDGSKVLKVSKGSLVHMIGD